MNLRPFKIAALVAVGAIAIVVGSATPGAYSTYAKWASGNAIVYISPANHDGLSADAVITALRAAMDDWMTQGHSPFTFTYGGRVNDTTTGYDNRNVVLFRNESNGGMIAATYSWADGSNHLLDSDIIIYDAAGYSFYALDGSCNSNLGNGVYLHDLATHEFGHMLGLQHSSDPSATMFSGYATCSTTPRTLESDDIAGLQALYGTSSSPPPTNTAPAMSIATPSNNASYPNGASITFSGSATDTQDGNLTSSLSWTSSIDGAIGSGGSFTRLLSAGSHVITASARDSGGLTGSSQVTITVDAAISNTVSPDDTTVPTATQIVDITGAVWTLGANGAILRNGVQAGGGWGSKILWKSGAIYVLGTDSNWWQWTGSGWLNVGTGVPGGSSASLDGTTVPSALQIVDTVGAVWTIGANGAILRNGVQAAAGWGSKILWKNVTSYVLGTDNNWWQWTGSGWINVGATVPGGSSASPDGTTVPTASQIVDNVGAVWTIGLNSAILRNGIQAAAGWGSKILWKNVTIYVLGTDNNWWQWTGSGWINVGSTVPGGNSASPDGTMVPSALQIVDNVGAVWTIGLNSAILRNGVQAGGGWGSKILWKTNIIYVYGTDANWWMWTGSMWAWVGPTQP